MMKHELSKELTYKVNSKEEYREFLKFIKSKGFNVYTGLRYTETWKHVQWRGDDFRLTNNFNVKYTVIDCKDVIGFKDSEEFVLPEKWCVCPETEENLDIIKESGLFPSHINNYRVTFIDNTYGYDKTYFTHLKDALKLGYTEITFEQFKKYVLKSSVKSEVKNQFVKGDYIVILSGRKNLVHVVDNYCYKQSTDSSNLVPDIDNIGGFYDASDVKFDNTVDKWRYATPEEIAEYNRIGKPYDVTTLNVKKDSEERLLFDYQIGKWYKWFWKTNSKITYGKISNVIPKDCFNVSEGIHNDEYCKINGYFFKDCESIELLTDLSEIQEYLPDEHVDKVKSESKSLVGRYLKALVDNPNCAVEYKKGDYILIAKDNLRGSVNCSEDYIFGNRRYDWKDCGVELMPEGFNPNSDDSFSERVSIEKIQEQCKEKFPIGCTLINTNGEEVVLTEDDCTYKIVEDCIWANSGNGLLYDGYEDSWAKLIELPKTESKSESIKSDIMTEEKFDSLFEDEKFKVGDWVVITSLYHKTEGSLNGKIGHIFQIGEISGIWYHCTKDTHCNGTCWPADCLRKATPEEISKITGKSVDRFHYSEDIVIKESKSSKFKPVDILNKYQQTPVIYSDKKVKSKLVTIFN